MRLVAFERLVDGARRKAVGSLEADGRVRPYVLSPAEAEAGIMAVVEAHGAGRPLPLADVTLSLDDLTLLAAFPQPRRNIFCVGKNYFEHAHEFARSGFDSSAAAGAVPEAPIIFSKVPDWSPARAIRADRSRRIARPSTTRPNSR